MLKILVGTTPYHVNVNSAHAFFVRLIFIDAIDYKTTKISRFTVVLRYIQCVATGDVTSLQLY